MEKHGLYLENSMDNGRKFMVEHIELSDRPEFCIEIEKWLKARYGEFRPCVWTWAVLAILANNF